MERVKTGRWAAFRDRGLFARTFLRPPRFQEFAAMFLVVFWALPEIGHRMLVRDDFYGLLNNELFINGVPDCDLSDEKIIHGKFIGVYPYMGRAREHCSLNTQTNTYDVASRFIQVNPPHTFIKNMAEILGEKHIPLIYHKNLKTNEVYYGK